MRYVLLVVGLMASSLGLVLLFEGRPQGGLWLQVGAGFLAIGVATCEIVAAIRDGSREPRGSQRWEQFRRAARDKDVEKMVRLLAAGGVPADLARKTAMSVVDDPNRFST